MESFVQTLAKLFYHMLNRFKAFCLYNSAAFILAFGLGIVIFEVSAEAFRTRERLLLFPLYLPHAVGLSFACALGLRVSFGNFFGFFAARAYVSLRMNVMFNITHTFGLLALALVGTIEVHLASFLLEKFLTGKIRSTRRTPDSLKDAIVFLAVVSTVPSACEVLIALIECTSISLPWSSFSHAWTTSWLGVTAAMINVSPFILHCFVWKLKSSLFRPRKLFECFLFTLLTLGLLAIIFIIPFKTFFKPLPYVFYPIIIYAVFRFDGLGWTLLLCVISVCAAFATINGRGSMYTVLGSPSPISVRDVLQIQLLISVLGAVGVVLSGAVREAKLLAQKLNRMNEELEIMVDQRTKELVNANEELQASKKAAEQASTAKSLFLANMSHEIRTPIHGILGMTALMLESELTVAQSDSMLSIKECADLLLQIISSILDLAKVEAGHMEVNSVPFSLKKMLNSTMRMLQPRAQALQLDLRWEIDNNGPDIFVGDPGKIQQCLLNLVGNSLKFTHEGSVVVKVVLCKDETQWSAKAQPLGLEHEQRSLRVSFHIGSQLNSSEKLYDFNQTMDSAFYVDIPEVDDRDGPQNENRLKEVAPKAKGIARAEDAAGLPLAQHDVYRISFEVSDTGIGISKEKLNDIFKPFTQADPSISRYYGGTGLGLCIVQRFVELMGGHISAECEIGKGSTFTFILPLECAHISKELHGSYKQLPNQQNSNCLAASTFQNAQLSKSESVAIVEQHTPIKEEQEFHIEELRYGQKPLSEDPSPQLPSTQSQLFEKPTHSRAYICIESKEKLWSSKKLQSRVASNDMKFTKNYGTRGASEDLVLEIQGTDQHQKGSFCLSSESQGSTTQPLTADVSLWLNSYSGQTHLKHRYKTKESVKAGLKNQLKLNILLAEDNAVNQKLASLQLQKHGHRVTIVGDGLQAASMLQTSRDAFDLVLMDVQMPVMDGLEATKRIREDELGSGLKRMPIIGLTAHAIQGYQETCLSAGMDAYLGKPFNINQLLDVIDALLQPKGLINCQCH